MWREKEMRLRKIKSDNMGFKAQIISFHSQTQYEQTNLLKEMEYLRGKSVRVKAIIIFAGHFLVHTHFLHADTITHVDHRLSPGLS